VNKFNVNITEEELICAVCTCMVNLSKPFIRKGMEARNVVALTSFVCKSQASMPHIPWEQIQADIERGNLGEKARNSVQGENLPASKKDTE